MNGIGLLLALSNAAPASPPPAPYTTSNTASHEDDTPPELAAPIAAPPDTTPSPGEEFAARRLTLEARLGLGAPTGVVGFAATFSPIPAFGFECGAGTNTLGLQLACLVRGRLVLGSREDTFGLGWARALTLSSGFSGGRYVDAHAFENLTAVDGPNPAELHFARAYWWNTDVGAEWRDGGFVMRVFVGVALLLNPNAYTIVKPESDSRFEAASTTLPYFGFGLGGAP